MHQSCLNIPNRLTVNALAAGELDEALARGGWFHVRFMDDILVLAPTHWKLRRAVRVVNEILAALDLRKHPAKTFIGRVEKGFDWLGYRLAPGGLRLAVRTVNNFVARMARLYEHTSGLSDRAAWRGEYVRRYLRRAATYISLFRCRIRRRNARWRPCLRESL